MPTTLKTIFIKFGGVPALFFMSLSIFSCHTDYGVDGQISEVTPNSWFCPRCMKFNPPTEDELAAKLRRQDDIKKEVFLFFSNSDAIPYFARQATPPPPLFFFIF